MPPRSDEHNEAVDRLYSLPLDEFTASRDELARDLRRRGDREGAAEIKGLRKPTAAAWALNQLRRKHRTRADELLAAGARLREAQQRLLAGEGRGVFQHAARDERRLVDQLVEQAERELAAAKQPARPAVSDKMRATLHAVATDLDARDEFAAGRLVRDYEPSGLGSLADAANIPPSPARRGRQAKEPATKTAAARWREIRRLEQRLEKARTRQRELEEKRGEAEDRLRHARDEAARAASALERAEADEEGARQRAEAAAETLTELEGQLRDATGAGDE